MHRKAFIIFTLQLLPLFSYGQVIPPCGQDYGTSADEANITRQMRYGSIADAKNALTKAKNSRGTALGCPQQTLNYALPDFSEPLLSEIEEVWNTVHAPGISAINISCPRPARYENNAALGAYYAMQAGYFKDTAKLAEIADMMVAQQYATWNITTPGKRNEGAFGYLHVPSSDPCYPGGVVGSSVEKLCSSFPEYCVTYKSGRFADRRFAVSGQDDDQNWHDGGLAYDHGWAGIQMIEASIMQNDLSLKQVYRTSAELAGRYAIAEHPVKNHNYTAKLIWLLAGLYAWTGDPDYKNELDYKLEKNLIPGILWDENKDGIVDETLPNIPFSSLTKVAQTPGRMWDGHNSLPWYHAMNAWALTEAYVAFRDRGETERAKELKPYVLAMLDNLSEEIIQLGVITPDALGVRDISYALLTGIWKITQFEGEAHPKWEQAAWAMWNTGYFNKFSTHSVNVGLYLAVKSGTPYKPYPERENNFLSIRNLTKPAGKTLLYPNPAKEIISVKTNDYVSGRISYKICDVQGNSLITGLLLPHETTIYTGDLGSGIYLIRIYSKEGLQQNFKFVKE